MFFLPAYFYLIWKKLRQKLRKTEVRNISKKSKQTCEYLNEIYENVSSEGYIVKFTPHFL